MSELRKIISETSRYDLWLYRAGAILGMLAFPTLPFFCKALYKQEYQLTTFIMVVMAIYLIFIISTFVPKCNKYVYLLAVISLYSTTLFFIYMLAVMDFKIENMLVVSIAISILASGFKTKKMMLIYIVSMILLCTGVVLAWSEYSTSMMINLLILIVWPLLLYITLRSKYAAKAEIEKESKFLKIVLQSIKDPTILLNLTSLRIIGCSESIATRLKLISCDDIVGKTIREVNSLYLDDIIDDQKMQMIYNMTDEKIEIDLLVNGKKNYFSVKSRRFLEQNKSYATLTILNITEEKNQKQKIYDMAFIDSLTKIGNRRGGINAIKEAIIAYDKTNALFAICFIDVDAFKEINDKYGHDSGDALLKIIANRITSAIRTDDFVYRIGGDEFMVIAKNLPNRESMDAIATQIINKVKAPIQFNNIEVSTTISIGISFFPNHGKDYKELLKSADMALYESKKFGGNNYSVYESDKIS